MCGSRTTERSASLSVPPRISTGADAAGATAHKPLHILIGEVLASSTEWTLAQRSIERLQADRLAGRILMRAFFWCVAAAMVAVFAAQADELKATVRKAKVDVYAEPKLDAAKLDALQQDSGVSIAAQSGLWYEVKLPNGKSGFVRVNDVRMNYAGTEGRRRERQRADEWARRASAA
jgi:hypothetical protein